MKELSTNKKTAIARMYFGGSTYDVTATKNNVSKGAVFNVVADLKGGLFPEAANLTEEIELLREAAVDLKQANLTPVQAIVGLSLISTLSKLNIEPSELDKFQSLIKTYTAPGADVPALTLAALKLDEVQKSTGLSVPELEAKVISLKEEAAKLEPLASEVKSKKKEITQLQDYVKKVTAEAAEREKYLDQLKQSMKEGKATESQLTAHVAELEERAFQADKQLTEARQDLKKLSIMGLSFDDLAVFTQRVKEVASHHAIKPALVRHRLMAELKLLDKCLGLETVIKAKTSQLTQTKESISQLEAKQTALASSTNQLLAQRDMLQADIALASQNLKKSIEAIGKAAQVAKDELTMELKSGIAEGLTEINKMRDGALQVGQQLGELQAMISSNEWLNDLVSLAKGTVLSSDGNKVRILALMILQPLSDWFCADENSESGTYFLRTAVDNVLKEMKKWKPQIAPATN